MNRVIIAIIIFVIILATGIVETIYVDKVFNEFDQQLLATENMIINENPASINKVRDVIAWWEKKRRIVEFFCYCTDIRALSVALAEVEGSLIQDDFMNAMSKWQSIETLSTNIHDLIDFNFEDIF